MIKKEDKADREGTSVCLQSKGWMLQAFGHVVEDTTKKPTATTSMTKLLGASTMTKVSLKV